MRKTESKGKSNLLIGILSVLLFLCSFLFTQPVFGNDEEKVKETEATPVILLKLTRG
ncbi:hypothetical protein [Desulforamulus ferrireducens]|uniref:hypothetical protein n=1 Tax=Desulforamulus ferrireducens TaxID=1833852 RepID=UPI0013565868|nr:hypothetical protein [Desulforamulus ferrireducens]